MAVKTAMAMLAAGAIAGCATGNANCPIPDPTESINEPPNGACDVAGETRCIAEGPDHDPNFVTPQVCEGGVFVSAARCDLRVAVCVHGACVASPDALCQ